MGAEILVKLVGSERAPFAHLRLGQDAFAIEIKEDASFRVYIIDFTPESCGDERVDCSFQLFAEEPNLHLPVLASSSQDIDGLIGRARRRLNHSDLSQSFEQRKAMNFAALV